MVKKKKGSEGMEISVETVVIFILIPMLIFGIILIKNIFDKPEFDKLMVGEECKNESVINYYSLDDFKMIDCPKEISEIDCYDNNGNRIKELVCEKEGISCYKSNDKKYFMVSEYTEWGYFYFNLYDLSFKGINFDVGREPHFIKDKTTEEICEQVEVK